MSWYFFKWLAFTEIINYCLKKKNLSNILALEYNLIRVLYRFTYIHFYETRELDFMSHITNLTNGGLVILWVTAG